MNARLYDAKLHRFLAPDNYIQDPYNTQNYNRYSYVLNNPLSYTDPSGEEITVLAAAIIGAIVSVAVSGIVNSINHQPFFQDAFWSAAIGAAAGVFSWGIGGAASGMSGVGKFAFQTISHGMLGGVMSQMNGGRFIHGFVSGAVGSMVASGAGKLLHNVDNIYLQAGGIVLSGGVSGGVASVVSGGKFWDGFRNGLISAGLNHAAHYACNASQKVITIKEMIINADMKPNDIAAYSTEFYLKVINLIPLLKEWYTKGGEPKLFKYKKFNDTRGAYYDRMDHSISVNGIYSDTIYNLVSNLFHELFHAYQWESGFAATTIKKYGPIRNKYSVLKSGYMLEIGAYGFQMSLGDTRATGYLNNSILMFNKL